MRQLIIFDMDGVIVQTHRIASAVMEQVVKEVFGLEINDEDRQKFYGVSDYEFYSDIISLTHTDVLLRDVLALQFSLYNHKLKNEVVATDGVVSLIKDFSKKYKVAICSGSTREQVDIVIERFDLAKYITTSISCDDVKRGKPDPEGYLNILSNLSIAPTNAVAVEDSPAGIAAALAAGIMVIGFDNGLGQDISNAHHTISTIEEMVPLIL